MFVAMRRLNESELSRIEDGRPVPMMVTVAKSKGVLHRAIAQWAEEYKDYVVYDLDKRITK